MGVETGAAEEIKDQERTRYGQPEDLSNLSMSRHFNATRDIDWEAPEMQIDPDHPGFDFSHLEEDPLLETEWFKNLDEKTRCNLGLTFYCHHFRLAIDFEHGAQTGMLRLAEFADRQSDEYRYILHEMAEEAQHTLMFHLFITKAGLTPPGTPKLGLLMYRMVAKWARVFPEAFWMWAFGCEDTGDNYLGVNIKDRNKIHPLAWRVIKIHMTEEARHITFAKIFVMRRIKNLGFMKKWHLMIFSMFVAFDSDDKPPGLSSESKVPERLCRILPGSRSDQCRQPLAVAVLWSAAGKEIYLITDL